MTTATALNLPHFSRPLTYGAIGDAWGYKHEFSSFDQIVDDKVSYPTGKQFKFYGGKSDGEMLVSDDTQMSLALAQSIAAIKSLRFATAPEMRRSMVNEIVDTRMASKLAQWEADRDAGKIADDSLPPYIGKSEKLLIGDALGTNNEVEARALKSLWIKLVDTFYRWSVSPENFRAPGCTCMGSLNAIMNEEKRAMQEVKSRHLRAGSTPPSYSLFARAPQLIAHKAMTSTGSGAVMRVAPVMSLPHNQRYRVALMQAVTTHNDPRAVFAAMVLVHAWEMMEKGQKYTIASSLKFIDKARRSPSTIVNKFITHGNDDVARLIAIPALPLLGMSEGDIQEPGSAEVALSSWLKNIKNEDRNGLTLYTALSNARKWNPEDFGKPGYIDPAKIIGAGGWDSISAVAYVLRLAEVYLTEKQGDCYTVPQDKVLDSMRAAIATSGDSDTIGCIWGHTLGLVAEFNGAGFDSLDTFPVAVESQYLDAFKDVDEQAFGGK